MQMSWFTCLKLKNIIKFIQTKKKILYIILYKENYLKRYAVYLIRWNINYIKKILYIILYKENYLKRYAVYLIRWNINYIKLCLHE